MIHPLIRRLHQWLGFADINRLETELQAKNMQLQQLHKQQKALYRVVNKVRASLDLETIFRTATKETCKLLGVERVSVYKFSPNWGGTFVADFEFASFNWDERDTLGKNIVWNDTYLQEHQGGRYRNNETLAVTDIYQAGLSQCHIDILEQFHIRSYATAPIFVGQKLWGILAVYQHSTPHYWQSSDIEFLSQVSMQLGFAVQQAEQLAQMEQKAKTLHEISLQQQILLNLISEIHESLDVDTLFKTTVTEVRKTLQADRVGVFHFDPNSNCCYGEFVSESVLPAYHSACDIKVRDNCFGEQYALSYQQGRMQIITDVYNAGLKDCHIRLLEQFQIRAQIVIPVLKGSLLWGLLCIHQCDGPREWTSNEIQFLKQVAAQFTVALGHSDLLTQTRLQTQQLTKAFDTLQEVNLQLECLAKLDGLTQIANRRYFDEFLKQEWQRLSEEQASLSIILFDVDYFKRYNDYYGHQAGDTCLIKIAQATQQALKRPSDLLARYGGEEFIIALPNTSLTEAIETALQIQSSILGLAIPHVNVPHGIQTIAISIGIASQLVTIDKSPQELIERADRALYKAKEQGRNCWVCDREETVIL